MILDKKRILELAENLSEEENKDTAELFEALGGSVLYEVFDEYTVQKIIENLIDTGKIHHYVPESGLDALEGLLNKQIVGNLGKFYNIKPEYILSLSQEQRIAMAKALSEGRKDLEKLLIESWNQGILTLDCGGESENAYLSIRVPITDLETISRMQKVSDEYGYPVNISKFDENVDISIYGDPNALYEDILSIFERSMESSDFLSNLIEAINFEQELEAKRSKGDYTEEQVTELLEDNSRTYVEEIQKLGKELEDEKRKHAELKERFLRVRHFVVNKIGRIPILGKSVLNLLKKDLGENELTEKCDEKEK